MKPTFSRVLVLVAALSLVSSALSQSTMLGCSAATDRCNDKTATSGSNKLSFSDGATLEFTADRAGEVTLHDDNSNAYNLPTQAGGPLVFLTGSTQTTLYGVVANSSVMLTGLKLTTAALSSSSSPLISSSNPLAVLWFMDGDNTNAVRLADSAFTYNAQSGIVTVMLPGTGFYVFVALPNMIDAGASGNVRIPGWSRQIIHWSSGFSLDYEANMTQTIASQIMSSPQVQAGVNLPMPVDGSIPLNKFIRIDVTGNNGPHNSTLNYTWTASDLTAAGIVNGSCLRFEVWLPAAQFGGCDCWRVPENQTVDMFNQTVTLAHWSFGYLPQWWGLFALPNCGSSMSGASGMSGMSGASGSASGASGASGAMGSSGAASGASGASGAFGSSTGITRPETAPSEGSISRGSDSTSSGMSGASGAAAGATGVITPVAFSAATSVSANAVTLAAVIGASVLAYLF